MSEQATTFQLGVTLPAEKAITETEDGDLVIEGLAADYQTDRQDEAFVPGAFDEAIKGFIAAGGPLMYHHKRDMQLGQVLDLNPGPQGLAIKAVIPKPTDPVLLDIYNKVKRGMMRGLSVSGRVLKKMTREGVRLKMKDLQEISVTPQPVGPNALFTVAQKAFPADFDIPDETEVEEYQAWFDSRYDRLMTKLDPEYVAKASPTAEQRKKYGMKPDGAFPVWHCGSGPGSVKSAMHLRGHSKQHSDEAVLKHIQSAARRLGCPDQAKVS